MATSTITLYNTMITPDKNALVEDIAMYLSQYGELVYQAEGFQYQKIEANMSVKVNIGQYAISGNSFGNYASIEQDGQTYYFFITDARWISQSAVELALAIDSLNTFPYLLYRLSDKTNVIREHRDRFGNSEPLNIGIDFLYKKIDKVPEGVSNLPKKWRDGFKFSDSTSYQTGWHLVYESPTTPTSDTPIDCYLMPDNANIPYAGGSGGNVEKRCNPQQIGGRNDFPYAPYYFGLETNNFGSFHYTRAGSTTTVTLGEQFSDLGIVQGVIFDTYKDEYDQPVSIKITVMAKSGDQIKLREITTQNMILSSVIFTLAANWVRSSGEIEAINAGQTVNYLASYSTLDLTNSKIIKTIQCPYCPIHLRWSGRNLLPFEGITITANGRLKVSPFIEFNRDRFHQGGIPELNMQAIIPSDMKHMPRTLEDSKLLNSDFTTYSLNYDSFGSEIKLEEIEWTSGTSMPTLRIDYKQSSKMASDLGFKWSIENGSYSHDSQYDNYLLSTRNNEDVIFTNAYLEYLKNGINFYNKQRTAESVGRFVGAAASITGATLTLMKSLAAGAAGGPLGVIAGISLAATAVATTTNAIVAEVNASNALEEKKYNLQLQGASIEGATDLALFNWYNGGNSLKWNMNSVDGALREKFDDLFYYCGYATNVQKRPTWDSRYWFNFLQCEAEFDPIVGMDQPEYVKWYPDFTTRLAAGITVYHNRNNEWDLRQQYENWETGLINEG